MGSSLENLIEIKGGLSKKKVFRKKEKTINKIIIDFSNDKKEFFNFLNIYEILNKINISVPKIYEIHNKKKIIVMEDFGNLRFDKILNVEELYNLLKLAVDNLIIIQNSLLHSDLNKLKKYKYLDLKKEISEFIDYYIPFKNILNFPVENFYTTWKLIYDRQNFNFENFVHKDYEFINLLFLKENKSHLKCGIIDFQSAFLGFIGWDLFSILENPRINFTRKYNEEIMLYYFKNISTKLKFDEFREHYYLLNLARQTRLLGRWVKIFQETNNKEYLNYIKTTNYRLTLCLDNIQNDKLKSIYKIVVN